MQLTDIHTHSAFSADGESPLSQMLDRAAGLGTAFYGVSDHFDYDYLADGVLVHGKPVPMIDAEAYFSEARRLQKAYAGRMRVLVGGEFGFSKTPAAQAMYREAIGRFSPDFVVNSVHTVDGADVWFPESFVGKTRDAAYRGYLEAVLESLSAPYPYDIVAHLGYVSRNAPYPDKILHASDYPDLLDEILSGIVAHGKILEVNSSARGAGDFLPGRDILERYFLLGGRKVSFASDAHRADAIGRGRETVVRTLNEIGFPGITVPDRGNHILVPFDAPLSGQ